jgi:phage terminase large subunit-like protein
LLALCRKGLIDEFLAGLTPAELQLLVHDWPVWARDDQLEPPGDWTTWLLLGGRGAGKTRAGAEWVRAVASAGDAAGSPPRIALVGEALADVRRVMVEGPSGILAVHRTRERPVFEPTLRRLRWPGGAVAELYSADRPDSLRGPQFSAAWCDETAKWRHPGATWDMLQFALRLGERPRQVVTTTPRPIALLKRLIEDGQTVVTRSTTHDNAANLAPAFIDAVIGRYSGTRLGRQEIDAEILDDNPHALWSRGLIERCRIETAPPLGRIVVGVDPPVTGTGRSDACGIVIAGRAEDGRISVLADETVEAAKPHEWAQRAVAAYHRFDADALVVEVNQGGDLVRAVIAQVDASVAIREVRATRGKWLRAEPVAAAYERAMVHHVGAFAALEGTAPTGWMRWCGRSPISWPARPSRASAKSEK